MREEVRAAYDELAHEYANAAADSPAGKPFLDALEARLDPGARVLDVGCGDGRPALTRYGDEFDPIGLDISREQLRLAIETAPETPLLQGEMTAIPLPASSVDAVVALYSIIHVPREEHRAVFEEWARVLRPGGWLLFTSGTEEWAGRNPDWLDSGVEMVWSYPGPEETGAALDRAGFALESTAPVPDSLADDGEKQYFLARRRGTPTRNQ
ncbi:MAG: class I SAM-dependent methyltransferase [Halodesulfurarchaeum sp.]|nr:class I SAM-dependent methyltransferase [Halodesulfurarchaeum sp.]